MILNQAWNTLQAHKKRVLPARQAKHVGCKRTGELLNSGKRKRRNICHVESLAHCKRMLPASQAKHAGCKRTQEPLSSGWMKRRNISYRESLVLCLAGRG
ncbi:unnamed protein product [Ostreobium quekettii]|uniref:Uncharacterized protein n=1 Tax=Ostreobium quekettii TaxID=121088 RepID=A0A8S1JJ27_9CHLO|nr:unnamed protein product [Ostreobium quekettii]